MWDNYNLLNLISNTLFMLVMFAVLYIISTRVIEPPLFLLREISVIGANETGSGASKLQHVTREQIEQIVRNEITGSYFTIDLTIIHQAFIKLPWVRTVQVHRDWPSGLKVMLEEHVALAQWGSNALVNTYGEVFRATIDKELPVFIGPMEESSQEIARQYASFSHLLEPLQQRIAEIHLSPRYAWRIRLETGTVLELGREQMRTRLARYTAVYDQSIAKLSQQGPLAYLDLRYPNGFAVRMPETMQSAPRKPGARKET